MELIKSKIRTIPNYPKKGIMFRDITTLLQDANGFRSLIDAFKTRYKDKKIDAVAGIEARGFLIAGALAYELRCGCILVRKKGKLPFKKVSLSYDLEYGKDSIEIHEDAVNEGDNILLVDDLLATGGTMLAACQLIEKLKGKIVECGFIVDLPELGGRKKLLNQGYGVFNLVDFKGK